jgi:hypothetical protein
MIETWWIATAHKRRQVASNKLAITIAIFMEYVAFYWKTRSWEVPPSGIFTRDIRQELSSRALLAYFYWGYPNPRVDAKVWPTWPTNFGDMTTCSRTSPAFGCTGRDFFCLCTNLNWTDRWPHEDPSLICKASNYPLVNIQKAIENGHL